MRWFGAAVMFLIGTCIAFVFLLYLSFFVGGTECDRAECGRFGEWADEHRGLFMAGLLGLSALGGLLLAGAFLRRERQKSFRGASTSSGP
jgi:hypothetical protein